MLLAAEHHDDSPYCAFAERFADLDKFGRLSRVGIEDIESLLGRRMMDDRQLRILAAGAPVNTDDHPYVEFSKMTIRDHDPELISQLAKEIRKSPEPDFEDPSCGYYNPDSQSKIEQVKENVLLHLTEN